MIEILRKIQLSWDMGLEELARLTHTAQDVLARYLALTIAEAESLPTVPHGLENALPLISIFTLLQELRPKLEDQLEWLRTSNSVLEDQVPLQVMMMSPEHLSWVSYTLDSAVRQKNL